MHAVSDKHSSTAHPASPVQASELLVLAYRLSRRRLRRKQRASTRPAWDVSDVIDVVAI